MHYRVRGLQIRSENAAKPMSQPLGSLVTWIKTMKRVGSALDYGCGKLRYTSYLASKCSSLGIVDSKVQLERRQTLAGHTSTVRDYASKHWQGCRIYDLEQFWAGIAHKYSFALCANVLSAIPSGPIRRRSLQALHNTLSKGGLLLVVNQHTNSYFTKLPSRKGSFAHLDGWVTPSKGHASFYGILRRDEVSRTLMRHHFSIQNAWTEGQSNFVLARKD